MGVFDIFRRQKPVEAAGQKTAADPIVGSMLDDATENIRPFVNDSITYSGSITGYNYEGILRDKQANIVKLYELSDYFSDADAVYRGIIKHVYTPFATSSPFRLIGGTDKTRAKYMDYYDRINLQEKWRSIAFQYFKYANVFVYWHNGNIVTLAPHKCRIAALALNGDPLVEYNIQNITDSLTRLAGGSIDRRFFDDTKMQTYLKSYPPEIADGVRNHAEWVQLNPENTFVLQSAKEDWNRYAIPMIAAALPALSKKALIDTYEKATMNLGIRGIVHAKYGEGRNGEHVMPSKPELDTVRRIFHKAMSGFPLAVTNHLVDVKFVQADMQDLFQFDKFRDVNRDILSSGGVDGIIVSGVANDGSTFATAQVSVKTVITRIQQAMDAFCHMMNKINMRVNGDQKGVSRTRAASVPEFVFMPLNIDGRKAIEDKCLELYRMGLTSTQTLLNTLGYDLDEELARRVQEDADGVTDTLIPRSMTTTTEAQSTDADPTVDPNEETRGRPEMTDDERNSDPDAALRGKLPKPSNENGTPETNS